MEKKQLRVLMIGAHPDDCDLLTGGIAIKYRNLGHKVKFVSVTNGNAGHYKLGGYELAQVRAGEARHAGEIAGIEYEVLDINDGYLEADIPTREKIIAAIREFQPDLIFTHRTNDYHPDHRRTGILVQDSSYLIKVPNVCTTVPCLRFQPVILYLFDDFKKPVQFTPDIAIGIDDVIEKKIQMLDCHKSQFYEWLPWVENELDRVPQSEKERFLWLKERMEGFNALIARRGRNKLIERYGEEKGRGIKYAEAFEVSEYGSPLNEENINLLFPF